MVKNFVLSCCLLALPTVALAKSEAETLREELAAQRALVQQQMDMLKAQQATIDALGRRVSELEGGATLREQAVVAAGAGASAAAEETSYRLSPSNALTRDSEGDLNRGSAAVQAGDYEGTFKIPGKPMSLAIGGFAKTVVYANSDAERQGAIYLPGLLGLERSDSDGQFNVDATMSRAYLSSTVPVETGRLRAYLEYDFNRGNRNSPDFNLRHAYASYSGKYGDFLVGQYWSTAMDLKTLAEALTDPTMSGALFARQAQVRYSLPFGSGFTFHGAIENPDSNDVFSDEPINNLTSQPDFVLGLEYDDPGGRGHIRLNSILRDIEIELPSGQQSSDNGWGVTLTGSLKLSENDKIALGGAYGEGLGRYLLGLEPGAGAVVDTAKGELVARENWGSFFTYSHRWQPGLRSAAVFGYAEAEAESFQPGSAFNNTVYAHANLLWSPLSYLTLGIEYHYGKSERVDGSDRDDHRILFGAQFF